MKSTWVAAGLLLVTICQAEQDYFGGDSTAPILGTMVFDKINYIPDEGNGPSFEICLKDPLPEAHKFQAVFEIIGTHIAVHNIEGTVKEETQCIIFIGNIKQLEPAEVDIIINALSDDDTVTDWGETHFAPFPKFPEEVITASYATDRLESLQTVLRVQGNLNGMKIINGLSPLTVPDTPQYYIGVIADTVELIPCSATDPPVCDVKITQVSPCDGVGPTGYSAILAYSHGTTKGTIAGTVSSTTEPTQLEVIISTDDVLTITQFCQDNYSEAPVCEIDWKNPGEKTAQIRLMGITTDGMTEINGFEIQDRELIITQLGTDILEGRWKMHEDKQPNQIYRLTINDVTADVDCTEITLDSHCFGYIPVSGTVAPYTFIVTNKIIGEGTYNEGFYNELEQIKTTKTVQATDPPQDLQIHDLPMEWHQNLMEVNTTICFSHETPNEEMIFSHYEMLMINTRGQWLKHKVMEEDDNGDVLCFTPFTINTQEFDVTEGVKVVVSQRASDGFSVIASGGSTLF